ncbi:hypothetical protein [Bacillus licheniformis]|nr:hypothetical protein [Bacillus licheniformis]
MNADRMMTSFKPVTNEWLGASSSSDGIKNGKKKFYVTPVKLTS